MVGENLTPAAGRGIATGANSGTFAARGFDISRLGQEVATELGVDPTNLTASGLTAGQIDRYEQQLHSGTQRQ